MSDQTTHFDGLRDPIGLCRTCRHARVIGNRRGSQFYLCQLSETDPRFAKYPRLPVLRCVGYQAVEANDSERS
jgi:hypothetical protein